MSVDVDRRCKLTVRQMQELARLREDGYSVRQLADKYQVSKSTVSRMLNHPPEIKKCGTYGGYHRHLRNNEVACAACCEAQRVYNLLSKQKSRWEKKNHGGEGNPFGDYFTVQPHPYGMWTVTRWSIFKPGHGRPRTSYRRFPTVQEAFRFATSQRTSHGVRLNEDARREAPEVQPTYTGEVQR